MKKEIVVLMILVLTMLSISVSFAEPYRSQTPPPVKIIQDHFEKVHEKYISILGLHKVRDNKFLIITDLKIGGMFVGSIELLRMENNEWVYLNTWGGSAIKYRTVARTN